MPWPTGPAYAGHLEDVPGPDQIGEIDDDEDAVEPPAVVGRIVEPGAPWYGSQMSGGWPVSDDPTAMCDLVEEEFNSFERPFELRCTGCGWRAHVEGAVPAALASLSHRDTHHQLAPWEPHVRIIEMEYRGSHNRIRHMPAAAADVAGLQRLDKDVAGGCARRAPSTRGTG